MNLIIKGTKDHSFINIVLLNKVIREIYSGYSIQEQQLVDDYLKSANITKTPSRRLLLECLHHLCIRETPQYKMICLDDDALIDNGKLKCSDIAYLLNFGNIQLPPLKVFDRVFEQVASNIGALYMWHLGVRDVDIVV